MSKNINRRMLVLRPWLSTVSGGDAYAHFDALVMHRAQEQSGRYYGDYRTFGLGDDGRKAVYLDNFRFKCQIDGRRKEPYAWQWGYQPADGCIFGRRDMERYGTSIAAIGRGLDQAHREDGVTDDVGRFIVRIARVLKLDGIALLEISRTGSFRDEMEILRSIAPNEYGTAIAAIGDLAHELHLTCVERSSRLAA